MELNGDISGGEELRQDNNARDDQLEQEEDQQDEQQLGEMDMEQSDGESDYLPAINNHRGPPLAGEGEGAGEKTFTHQPDNDDDHNSNFDNHSKHEDRFDVDKDNDNVDNDNARESKIVQILNVSPSVTLEQITTLFAFLGDIVNIELYQNFNDYDLATNDYQKLTTNHDNIFKVCFVEFAHTSSVKMALHLTNTVFIDRALTVLPYNKSPKIPDRESALAELEGSDFIYKFNIGTTSQVINGVGGAQLIATVDPKLTALGLPQYPQLPLLTEPARLDEIRRTVYIGSLDSTLPPDQVLKFFNDIGEVKYIRVAGDETQPTRFAFVEFNHQASIANALQHNGFVLGSRPLKINHSNNPIVKPPAKPLFELPSLSGSQDSLKRDRGYSSRDDHRHRHSSSNRYHDRDRSGDRRDRRVSPRGSRDRRRSRSKDNGSSRRRRSRSRDDGGHSSSRIKRSRSRDRSGKSNRRSRSREPARKVRRSRSRSNERFKPNSRRRKRSRR